MAGAASHGGTASTSHPIQLLGCTWSVVTTSVVLGVSACSTAYAYGDQAQALKVGSASVAAAAMSAEVQQPS